MILLKVIEIINAWIAIIDFLIMDSNFKILYAMVAMIWQLVNISTSAIGTIENVDYRCVIHNTGKSEAINLLENFVLENCGDI